MEKVKSRINSSVTTTSGGESSSSSSSSTSTSLELKQCLALPLNSSKVCRSTSLDINKRTNNHSYDSRNNINNNMYSYSDTNNTNNTNSKCMKKEENNLQRTNLIATRTSMLGNINLPTNHGSRINTSGNKMTQVCLPPLKTTHVLDSNSVMQNKVKCQAEMNSKPTVSPSTSMTAYESSCVSSSSPLSSSLIAESTLSESSLQSSSSESVLSKICTRSEAQLGCKKRKNNTHNHKVKEKSKEQVREDVHTLVSSKANDIPIKDVTEKTSNTDNVNSEVNYKRNNCASSKPSYIIRRQPFLSNTKTFQKEETKVSGEWDNKNSGERTTVTKINYAYNNGNALSSSATTTTTTTRTRTTTRNDDDDEDVSDNTIITNSDVTDEVHVTSAISVLPSTTVNSDLNIHDWQVYSNKNLLNTSSCAEKACKRNANIVSMSKSIDQERQKEEASTFTRNEVDMRSNKEQFNSQSKTQEKQITKEYLQDNAIPELFNELTKDIFTYKPENVLAFTLQWLSKQRDKLLKQEITNNEEYVEY